MLKWIAIVLIALLIALQVKLWTGEGGMRDLRAIRARVTEQQAQNVKLRQRNEALHADVEDLKHGQDAVEARARSQLGLIKPGEVFYQVVGTPGTSGPVVPPARAASVARASGPAVPAASATAGTAAAARRAGTVTRQVAAPPASDR